MWDQKLELLTKKSWWWWWWCAGRAVFSSSRRPHRRVECARFSRVHVLRTETGQAPGRSLLFHCWDPERSRALHSKSVVMNTAPRRVDCSSFKHSTSAWWLVNEYPLHHRRRDWFPTKVGLKWRLYGRRDAPSGEAERQERRRGHGRESTSLADDWVTVGTTSLSAHRCSMLEARPPVLSNERSGNVQAPFRCGPHKEFVEGWRRTGRWAGLLSVEENFSLNENDWCRHTKSHFKLAWQRFRNRPDASVFAKTDLRRNFEFYWRRVAAGIEYVHVVCSSAVEATSRRKDLSILFCTTHFQQAWPWRKGGCPQNTGLHLGERLPKGTLRRLFGSPTSPDLERTR